MSKTIAILVLGLAVGVGLRSLTRGGEPPPPAKPAPAAPKAGFLVDLGNPTCPILGHEVDGETFVEWRHLRIGFCCEGCDKKFLRDPEERAPEGWREAAAAVEAYLAAEGEAKAARLAEIEKRWKVVRR